MKLRIYLDTSVISARLDSRSPERAAQTEEFWNRLSDYVAGTSELARTELTLTPDPVRRANLLAMLPELQLHPVTEEMHHLAKSYVDADVFSPNVMNDAIHVAAAVLTRQDILVSWNFRHLVNRSRRARVNLVNAALGLPSVEILAPPEV